MAKPFAGGYLWVAVKRTKAAIEEIARKLKRVGIRPWLDKWDLSPGDKIRKKLEWAIQEIPCAALFFGPADVGKWHILEIDSYIERWAGSEARMVPVILPNAPPEPAIPLFVRQTLWVDMRDWKREDDDGFYRLVCGILGRPPGDSPKGLMAPATCGNGRMAEGDERLTMEQIGAVVLRLRDFLFFCAHFEQEETEATEEEPTLCSLRSLLFKMGFVRALSKRLHRWRCPFPE